MTEDEQRQRWRAASARYRHRHRDRVLERYRKYFEENTEKRRAAVRANYRKNPGAHLEYNRAWRQKNPEKVRAQAAARGRRIRERTPAWVDTAGITIFYVIARRVSACTGIKFHVDHITPLCGTNSSGLHVPWNLRVIPAAANLRKYNKLVGELL